MEEAPTASPWLVARPRLLSNLNSAGQGSRVLQRHLRCRGGKGEHGSRATKKSAMGKLSTCQQQLFRFREARASDEAACAFLKPQIPQLVSASLSVNAGDCRILS